MYDFDGKAFTSCTLLSSSTYSFNLSGSNSYFIIYNSPRILERVVDLSINQINEITLTSSVTKFSASVSIEEVDKDYALHMIEAYYRGHLYLDISSLTGDKVYRANIPNIFVGREIVPETFVVDCYYNDIRIIGNKTNNYLVIPSGSVPERPTANYINENYAGILFPSLGFAYITSQVATDAIEECIENDNKLKVEFKSARQITTKILNCISESFKDLVSNNLTYDWSNEEKETFIDKILILDNDYNVVGTARLEQPIPKKSTRGACLRVKYDL